MRCITKVGLCTRESNPKASTKKDVKVVFPEPSSPKRAKTMPGLSLPTKVSASFLVSVVISQVYKIYELKTAK